MKTPHTDRQKERLDRVGATIAFVIFFGTLIYVLIETFFLNK